jgi:hypothetical protein
MTIALKGLPLPATRISEAISISTGRETASKIHMKRFLFGTVVLFCLVGCTQTNPSPEQIRQDAEKATSTTVRDVKAAAKGVADGLKQKGPVNINKASSDDLQTLPGIDAARAQRIIDGRPYDTSGDLVKKHLISRDEYNRIADKVVAQ